MEQLLENKEKLENTIGDLLRDFYEANGVIPYEMSITPIILREDRSEFLTSIRVTSKIRIK